MITGAAALVLAHLAHWCFPFSLKNHEIKNKMYVFSLYGYKNSWFILSKYIWGKMLIRIHLEFFVICWNLCIHFTESLISFFSVKSCFQNMEICKRRVHMYDTVSQIKSPFTTHVAPNTSTNLTMSFSNQLNTVHNQVFSKWFWKLKPKSGRN